MELGSLGGVSEDLEKSGGAGGLRDVGVILFGGLKGTWQRLRNLGGHVIWGLGRI